MFMYAFLQGCKEMKGIQFGTKVHPKSKDFMWLFQISKLLKEITKGGREGKL